ncbi:AraC family transcriptional regulator [Paenibacillus agricola]|uniref:Helix-turn-helix transcriptional regulator n=1 Tax=Paenibacillus agricola TaxID=2716264 RepID=A0ABX0J6M2_9BACL|nr:AraC family transcriptional regulator [Paenibacillus agricola]NHN30507.1 helix-turn-helix transcriptional regulator [Paenibacillus agricola]
MDMQHYLNNDQLEWNADIENTLNRFPILLRFNEWIKGTNYHYQPGLEIHITQEGEGTLVVGRQVLLQSPRSVVVFRATVPHQMISKSSYKRAVICINFAEAEHDVLPSLHRLIDFGWVPEHSCLTFSLTPKQFQEMEVMCKGLRQELSAREIGWERMALAYVLQVTAFLQRSTAIVENVGNAGNQITPPMKGRKNDLVQLCSDYVCNNLAEELTLKTVAKKFAVSEEHLTRSFTKEMNISFYQYVLLQRVAAGKRLLKETSDVSITEIAFIIGFPSSSHFSRHFRALTEETPTAYRQRLLETQSNG